MQRRDLPRLSLAAVVVLTGAACGSDGDDRAASPPSSVTAGSAADNDAAQAVRARLDAIGIAVDTWERADTVEGARAAAETAANLVVGPAGPAFGDRDGDGSIGGDDTVGLLPGLDGSPVGLAEAMSDQACISADVLGGPWDDAAARWLEMSTAIEQWRPDDNTMPSLASHPMRIVGWATFTLATEDLALAHEYAGHAQLHVTVSEQALAC